MVPFESFGTVSYSHSISLAVSTQNTNVTDRHRMMAETALCGQIVVNVLLHLIYAALLPAHVFWLAMGPHTFPYKSIQLLPRDVCISAAYAVVRCLSLCPSVCLSGVCLSRSCVESKRVNISSNFFRRRLATPFWCFSYQALCQYSDRDLLTGASNAAGVLKNRDFRPTSRFIADMIKIGPYHGTPMCAICRLSLFPMTLNDP